MVSLCGNDELGRGRKGWGRRWKLELIEKDKPEWRDLHEGLA